MEKGYYKLIYQPAGQVLVVAIHNKNGKGLLQGPKELSAALPWRSQSTIKMEKGYYQISQSAIVRAQGVAIHNKNGKGLLLLKPTCFSAGALKSQSTIKMEKGYYITTTAVERAQY